MKLSIKNKGFGALIALIGAVVALVAAVGCIIYGAAYEQYADFTVVLCLIAGAVILAAYALADAAVIDWFNLLGVAVVGFGTGLFLVNSYNVWADTWGNLSQYGSLTGDFSFFNSQGGPIPAAILIILGLVAAVCGIIACFVGKEAAK